MSAKPQVPFSERCARCDGNGCGACGGMGWRCETCHQPRGLCRCHPAKSRTKPLPTDPEARAAELARRLDRRPHMRSALIWLADLKHDHVYTPHDRTRFALFEWGLVEGVTSMLPVLTEDGIATLRALGDLRTRDLADQAEDRRRRERPRGDGTLLSMLGGPIGTREAGR